ncbi:MAG: bifunctional diaminohydroxyphosphoribosylaminopyrimidine deaminase/5-amino-6-(5-phosphoribosylamino)uracil reductase RibD [Alphaproteobacteria bacterium]|nr:MAG: bifunctional diaminohydroxyphosphoribosylaminopyrimidine deaminase/5-amino-6-(5-phosphoribosylamino)uracil reductase RibD [Alphaproteobacteria bacterium]
MARSPSTSTVDLDRRLMELALRMAHRMLGRTAPNPAVGAIIADETTGEIITRGWTQPGGRPHAEGYALDLAGARARGLTMYVSLEPCSHHGRTPPCANAIVAAGMRRVVCAIEDPNPEIAGRGLAVLRDAGVVVDLGLCAEEARWMAAGHILRMTRDRPFVQLKIAVSADGLIAPGDGAPRWVTGPEARQFAHVLRARADAILVGRKTVADDNPELTCRLPGLEGRSPRRIILDAKFRTSPTAKMLQTAERVPVTIFGDTRSTPPPYPRGVEVRRMPAGPDGRLNLSVALESLAAEGVTRVLVEGGPTIAGAFLAADLVDEVVIGHGTETLGSKGRMPVGDHGLEFLARSERWQTVEERGIGADRLSVHRRTGRFASEPTP